MIFIRTNSLVRAVTFDPYARISRNPHDSHRDKGASRAALDEDPSRRPALRHSSGVHLMPPYAAGADASRDPLVGVPPNVVLFFAPPPCPRGPSLPVCCTSSSARQHEGSSSYFGHFQAVLCQWRTTADLTFIRGYLDLTSCHVGAGCARVEDNVSLFLQSRDWKRPGESRV